MWGIKYSGGLFMDDNTPKDSQKPTDGRLKSQRKKLKSTAELQIAMISFLGRDIYGHTNLAC
ncbi:MAG: hypothetical protein K0R69_52 [Clostridia bacterium]|jgi:hypothetical protein|nr:hypothetical protein [Clostridia bacterium]